MCLNIISLQTKTFHFKDQLFSSLTAQQKKIILIASLAFGFIAAAIFLYRKGYFKATINDEKKEEKGTDKLLAERQPDDNMQPVENKKLKRRELKMNAVKKLQQEEEAKKLQQEEASKKLQEIEQVKKLQKEEAAKKLQEEEKNKKLQQEEAAKKLQEDEKAKKLAEEEKAKKLIEEEKAKKLKEEEDAKKIPPKTALEIEAESDPIKAQLLKDYSPQMVEALGGLDKMKSFPINKDWKGRIGKEDLKAPVMLGQNSEGPFLIFCYLEKDERGKYELKGEYIAHTAKGWKGAYASESQLNLRAPNHIEEGSLEEKHMLNRIRRLMNGEAVGGLKRFDGAAMMKPADKETIRPKDSLLKGDDMTAYMELDTLFYERELEPGTTDLYSWDPAIDKKTQRDSLLSKFPNANKP